MDQTHHADMALDALRTLFSLIFDYQMKASSRWNTVCHFLDSSTNDTHKDIKRLSLDT